MVQRSARLVGVDVARALAIVGMVAVHFAPRPQRGTGWPTWVLGVPYGKASILFALLAGIGVSILVERRASTVRARLLYRTMWLFPLGLWLQQLEHPVAVILQYYAIWFAFAALFVHVSDRALMAWAVGLLPLGSIGVAWVGINHPGWLLIGRGDSPGGVLMDIVLTGFYPTVTWLPVVLFGMWIGRRDLGRTGVSWTLAGGGVAAMGAAYGGGRLVAQATTIDTSAGGWGRLLSIDGHSEMPLAVIGSAGSVIVVLGLCLLIADTWPRFVRPVAAMGEGALTVYVSHLVIWHFWNDLLSTDTTAEAWVTLGWFFVASAAFMTAWLAIFPRGPLEIAVRAPWEKAFLPLIRMANGESLTGEAVVSRPRALEASGGPVHREAPPGSAQPRPSDPSGSAG